MALDALSQLSIELSARCNKTCYFCGHQNANVNPAILQAGDMDFALLERIAKQVPCGIIVQFHRDGEPMIYLQLRQALGLFAGSIRSIVTNGKNLGDRGAELIGSCERITVSVFDGDLESAEQHAQLSAFLRLRPAHLLPAVNIKIVGEMDAGRLASWTAYQLPIIRRQFHHPAGDWNYRGSGPPIPESMMCLDLLSHPSIDWQGNLYLCNRLQPKGEGKLGNLYASSLEELWNGEARAAIIRQHVLMQREQVPACRGCEFWGLPAG